MTDSGWASGVVIALLGLWILLRTISTGTNGSNLADWLLSLGGNNPQKQQSASSAAPTGPPKNTAGQTAPIGVGPRPQGRNVQGGARS